MVTSFRGSSLYTLDEKGRLTIPPRFREVVRDGGGDVVMLTQWEKCVWGYALDEWSQLEKRILAKSDQSQIINDFRRYFVGSAHECPFDKQGRVLIPPMLRKYAQLEKEILLVGNLNHFEVWSSENWELRNQQFENNMQNPEERKEIVQLGL